MTPPANAGISELAAQAIDSLIEQQLKVPAPSEEACRRHHSAHQGAYRTGEKVRVRHILFAVTPGVDVVALRKRAEAALLDVRCHNGDMDHFAGTARELAGRTARRLPRPSVRSTRRPMPKWPRLNSVPSRPALGARSPPPWWPVGAGPGAT